MRVAVILLSVLVVATPSHASDSCRTKAEARHHFGSVHIYWHGPDHCWDATPSRRRHAQGIGRKNARHDRRQNDEPRWREAKLEVLPDSGPIEAPPARTLGDIASYRGDAAGSGADWLDRWVDVVQVAPIALFKRDSETTVATRKAGDAAEPMVTPYGVVLIVFGMVLMLAPIVVRCSLRES
jgi:hypothetical protein